MRYKIENIISQTGKKREQKLNDKEVDQFTFSILSATSHLLNAILSDKVSGPYPKSLEWLPPSRR